MSVPLNVFSRILSNNTNGLFSLTTTKHLTNQQFKMNNNSSNYSSTDYLNSQYFNENNILINNSQYTDLNLDNNLSDNLINYNFKRKLNNLPVNYYHENYSDLLNNSTKLFNKTINNTQLITNQTSKRFFHRNSIICSSMKDKSTADGENVISIKRPIDHIEELIANKTLIQTDLSTSSSNYNSSSICSTTTNMITNSSNDEQKSNSIYNNSSNPSRQQSFYEHSPLSAQINNENNSLPKLMPIIRNGRFENPFDTWNRSFIDTIKFLLTPTNIGLPKNQKDLDITLPVVRPILSHVIPDDNIRVSWIGHATVLVQFENVSLITDPHFSAYSHPFKLNYKRYRPTPCRVDELPDNLNTVLISHNHYDHLDYDTIIKLNKRYKTQLTYFVPLGMKNWFTKIGISTNVIELNWWEEKVIEELDDLKIVGLPSQHWSRRGAFDENKELWISYGVFGKSFSFYFAGDTGYSSRLFKTIGQYYKFSLSAIPIGAYEPNKFLKYQHVNPKEAVQIHKDIKSNLSIAIHWGTFGLSHEHYLDPAKKLISALDEESIPRDRFLVFEHGETRLLDLNGISKRENTNRYAK